MNKKRLAKEYIILLKWLVGGYLFWLAFLAFMAIFNSVDLDSAEVVFGPFGAISFDDGLVFAWIIAFGPYVVYQIVRSIKWAKKEIE